MTKKLVTLATLLGAGLALAGGAAAADKPYDCTWTVLISTEEGPFDHSYNYAVAIEDGRVQQASGNATISGRISSDGTIGLGLRSGPATADASGRLKSNKGSGTWTLPMLGCSGSWTARKHGGIQANAF